MPLDFKGLDISLFNFHFRVHFDKGSRHGAPAAQPQPLIVDDVIDQLCLDPQPGVGSIAVLDVDPPSTRIRQGGITGRHN